MGTKLNAKQSVLYNSKKRYLFADGGIRSGKTWVDILIALKHAQENDGMGGRPGPAKILFVKETYGALFDSVIPDFQKLCPPGWIKSFSKSLPRVNAVLNLGPEHDPVTVFFRAAEDALGAQRRLGMTVSLLVVDQAELIPPDAFDHLDGRVSMPGVPCQVLLNSNPQGHDWLWHRFIKDKVRQRPLPEGDVEYVVFDSYDNTAHLDSAFFAAQERKHPYWKARYLHGSREEYAGLIWSQFSEDVHVYDKDTVKIPASWKRFRGIDHGFAAPTCCLWMAMSPNKILYVYREYYDIRDRLSEHIDEIKELSGDEKYAFTVIDSHCFATTGRQGDGEPWCVADDFLEGGVIDPQTEDFLPGTRNKDTSTNFVAELLAVDKSIERPVPPFSKGSPRLFVSGGCQNLIDEIGAYRSEDLFMSPAGQMYGRDRAEKGADHACDALRYATYGIREEFEEIEPEKPKEKVWNPDIVFEEAQQRMAARVSRAGSWMGE